MPPPAAPACRQEDVMDELDHVFEAEGEKVLGALNDRVYPGLCARLEFLREWARGLVNDGLKTVPAAREEWFPWLYGLGVAWAGERMPYLAQLRQALEAARPRIEYEAR